MQRAEWLLVQVLDLLPSNRDWLDPYLEREMRDIKARCEKEAIHHG